MLDENGFDLWADGYDRAVGLSDEADSYPFAGYREVLSRICAAVLRKQRPSVLDVGFGTGVLTKRLYDQGCRIYGQDFSAKMLALAQEKMPDAELYREDFTKGLAQPLWRNTYDFVIATYSLHHLADKDKPEFLRAAQELLAEDGMVLIGDVAFRTRAELERCRQEAGDRWDADERYFVYDELAEELPKLRFEKISRCAGLLSLSR